MNATCPTCQRLAEVLAELLDPNVMKTRATASRVQANLTGEPRAQIGQVADYLNSGRIELADGAEDTAFRIHTDYLYWAEERGLPQLNAKRFGIMLTRIGIGARKGAAGVRLRTGIRLT